VRPHFVLGIDIGGTFTDFVLLDRRSGAVHFDKLLTTPGEPERAVLEGVDRLLGSLEADGSAIEYIVHGTTLATNVIIERKGERIGLLTTRGFRDVLEMRRERRYDPYDLMIELPIPLVPRRLRREVTERVSKDGTEVAPLDTAEAVEAVRALLEDDIRGLAIAFLYAPKNASHEETARGAIAEAFPELPISLSSAICPELGEYERASTTVVNAYIRPVVSRYLTELQSQLRERIGYAEDLYVMLSSGGLASADYAAEFPVRFIESGPAGGAMAAALLSRPLRLDRVIAYDMGGTTAKICVINDYVPATVPEFEVARVRWYQQGSGLPVRVPFIDMIEIGLGGGSIARIDELGLMKVGPHSAGADPGPASYGRGGTAPTITDADLVLGYLNPNYFLGGAMTLDTERARAALGPLADALEMDVVSTAAAVVAIANEEMAKAARLHLMQRGYQPEDYTLAAAGGAGPVHAYRLAQLLGIGKILCPAGAGVASAFGFVTAPFSIELVQGYDRPLGEVDPSEVLSILNGMRERAQEQLQRVRVAPEEIRLEYTCSVSFEGQRDELYVPFALDQFGQMTFAEIEAFFRSKYERLFGATNPGLGVRVAAWHLRATAGRAQQDMTLPAPRLGVGENSRGERPAYFAEIGDWLDCAVYDRYTIKPGETISGPAIVEESESTVVIGPGGSATADDAGNLLVQVVTAEVRSDSADSGDRYVGA
jgi:N-methylhydantoinase A